MKYAGRHVLTHSSFAVMLIPLLAGAGGCFEQDVGLGSDTGGGQGGAGGGQTGAGGMTSGAGGMMSGAGGMTSGAGGMTSGAGGEGGDPISAAVGWPKRIGQTGHDRGYGIAVDAAGNVIVTGDFTHQIDFGGGSVQSEGHRDLFVAKYTEIGDLVWATTFGEGADDIGHDVALGSSGDVVVTGLLQPQDGQNIFLARFDAAGTQLWEKRLAGPRGLDVALDGAGNVFLLAGDEGSIDFGGGPLANAGYQDIYLAKLDAAGNHLWSKHIGGPDVEIGKDIAVDGAGNVVLVGWINGTADFGGGPLTSAGGADGVVAKYDPDGNHLWSKIFGDAAPNQYPTAVAVDGSGGIVLTGAHLGSVDYGGGPLTSEDMKIFVVKLDAGGNHVFSHIYGEQSDGSIDARGISVSSAGTIAVVGDLQAYIDFGGGAMFSWGRNVFWAKLDSAGDHLSSGLLGQGSESNAHGQAIAISPTGPAFVTGMFESALNVDTVSLTSSGWQDVFVAKLP